MEKREEGKIKQDRSDTEWVLSTEQGRRFLWNLVSYCGVYHSFEGDVNHMLKQEGKRQVGLHLLGVISDASEDQLFKMMLEAKNKSIEEKISNDNGDKARTATDELDNYLSGGVYESRTKEFGDFGPII